jgi:hypothetical protein
MHHVKPVAAYIDNLIADYQSYTER